MEDLYRFVNGEWIDKHEIPADRGIDGAFHALRDQSEIDVRTIAESHPLYQSFMDTSSLSADSLAPDFELIDTLPTTEFLGKLERTGVSAPVSGFVAKDSASEDVLLYLVQSGLGLPDEAYYREPQHAEVLAEYEKHVARMLDFFGLEGAEEIVALEKKIAAGHWDVVAARDAQKTFNPVEFADLPSNIQAVLRAAGIPEFRVISMMPSYVEHLSGLLEEEDWKLWAKWHVIKARAGLLPDEISKANFDFYGTVLTGASEQKDRWKRAVSLVEGAVGFEIGKQYVEKFFPASSKEQMLELVDYLLAAYHDRISQLEWMTPETRSRALEKLGKFKAKIGYPDKWRTYDIDFTGELVEDVRRANAFNHEYELAKIGKPADRDEWFATPQTVNAFYNPVVNDITFPAAILREPFFSPDASAASNFGAIGAVIGHEIGHGFDDQGSQYDGDGNLNQWWTDEDREAFTKLTDQLVEQFDGLVPSVLAGTDSSGVNGKFTLGENIGDLGGLGIAMVAFKKFKEPTKEELQEFFFSWARVWRSKIRPELAKQYLAIDPHSPAEFRCNVTASNIPEFYEAFDMQDPGNRVTIW